MTVSELLPVGGSLEHQQCSTADKERNLVLLLLDFYFYGNQDVTGACNA